MPLLSVLVVDCDETVCECLRELLERDGCEVVTVCDAGAAVAALKARRFHIVTLDPAMPTPGDVPWLDMIKSVDPDVAIVIIAGRASLDVAAEMINGGASAYLQKPFSADEIRQTIAHVARKNRIVVRREDELHVAIGQNVMAARKKKSMTLKEMRERSGLAIAELARIERAESSPSISSLYRIATALDIRITDVLGDF